MAFTTTTIADVAKDPSGIPIPFAVVVSNPRVGFANSGTNAAAHSAIANAAGSFSLAGLECTDDAATAAVDPGYTGGILSHHVAVIDPHSGEHVYDVDCAVPHVSAPTTLALLQANPV